MIRRYVPQFAPVNQPVNLPRNLPAKPIRLSTTDRCLYVGKTGSGKTTLAKTLMGIRNLYRAVILDPKHSESFNNFFPIFEDYDPSRKVQTIRTKFGPDVMSFYSDVMGKIFKEGDTLVYVDEVTLITNLRPATPNYGSLIRQGRERGIGVWSATQRPKDIPPICYTESEHFFIFRLSDGKDRQRVAEFTGDKVRSRIDTIRGHEFLYYNDPTEDMQKRILDMNELERVEKRVQRSA